MKRRKYLLVLTALAVLTVPACRTGTEPPPLIRVGYASHDHHSPIYVAAGNPEYFKEHGGLYLREVSPQREYDLVSGESVLARVTLHSSVGGAELIRKLSEDHFDVSFGGVPAMLNFIDGGAPIRIVSPVMAEGAGLVVRKDLPVDSWEEFLSYLKGREDPFRVGYKIGTSVQNLIFEHALGEVGVAFGHDIEDLSADVILVNVHGPKNLIPSLESGLIDGFVIMQPFLALAERKGVGKTIAMLNDLPPEGRWAGNPCCALAASNAFVEAHRPAAEAFVTLMMRASAFIVSNPEESAAMVSRWLGIDQPVEEASLPTIRFTVDFDESWERGVDFWIESMVSSGRLKGPVKDTFSSGTYRELVYDLDLYRDARGSM